MSLLTDHFPTSVAILAVEVEEALLKHEWNPWRLVHLILQNDFAHFHSQQSQEEVVEQIEGGPGVEEVEAELQLVLLVGGQEEVVVVEAMV